MKLFKTCFPFVVLSLALSSFSDCSNGDRTKDSTSKADTMHVQQDVPAKNDTVGNEQQASNTDMPGTNSPASEDTTTEVRKGPPPRPLEPRWTGGDHEAIQAFFRKHAKYPDDAKKNDVKGIVYVMFTVKANGEADNFKVRQGLGHGCDEEAIRLIKLLGKWEPGKAGGKPVDMEYSLGVPCGE